MVRFQRYHQLTLDVPSTPCLGLSVVSTPEEITVAVNKFILRENTERWEQLAGRKLTQPEVNPGFCKCPSCPNSAVVFYYCVDCCRNKYKVRVGQSTLPDAGLGLFASKTFSTAEENQGYICDYCFDMRPDKEGIVVHEVLMNVVQGDYALRAQNGEKWYGGDAAVLKVGGKKISGLARYCNDGGKQNNAIFTKKEGTVYTWGIKVISGKQIKFGQEIFISYGNQFQWPSV
jgi:hypothetical protein